MTEHHADEESESAREERHRGAERRHWAFEKIGGSGALFLTAVAAGGAIASAFATFWAYKETQRTAEAAIIANQISTRPYIKITFETDKFVIHQPGYNGNDPDVHEVKFFIQNIGKLPGLADITSATTWGGRNHPEDEKHWPSITSLGQLFLFPSDKGDEFTVPPLALTSGQIIDLTSGDKFYVMIDVLYGASKQYETKVCTVFPMDSPAAYLHVLTLSRGYPCPSEGSNYAK